MRSNNNQILKLYKVGLFAVTLFFSLSSFSQEIALTFDDAPVGDGAVFTGMERTSRIIETLKKHEVAQVAFFVITSHINSEGLQRLKMYSDAGHLLANHSHSHNWIRSMGTANYIRDIYKADSTLKAIALPYQRWYRYPFLNEGQTKTSRDSIRAALTALSLMNAYVTIDNYDWYINGAMSRAIKSNAKIDYNELKNVYLEHIWNSIQFYDNIGRQVLRRSPKHVLLLHENDLAALFLDDLIQFLKNKGWKIISPQEAYSDPIAKEIPDVLFNGQGRVGAIGFANGLKPAMLVQESEDESYLDRLLMARKVFK
ncbi:MAG TPA: polysaccharide deacetylase family protein [Chryseosolibacter sp.]|nr:polysaccharide deacetylase family protein [Chryseosolibacter sp.]